MDIGIAKDRFEAQFSKAIHSKSNFNRFHPLRVIQALKSLVGIDIENPNESLLIWGEEYLSNEDCFSEDYFRYKLDKPAETIVISDLGKYILLKNRKACLENLQDLCLVSDGSQIFEYLLEFSAYNNVESIPFIWSAYRTNLFLDNKHTYLLLLKSVDILIEESIWSKGLLSEFENDCIIESIRNNPLTRKEKITQNLTDRFSSNILIGKNVSSKIVTVVEKGRIGILNYINELRLEDVTPELILLLDACRMVLKDSDPLNYPRIENALNYIIENKIYDKENW